MFDLIFSDGIKEEKGTYHTFPGLIWPIQVHFSWGLGKVHWYCGPRKILPKWNVVIYHTEFDEFKKELYRRKWNEELTSFDEGSIDVAILKEFYAY